MGKVKEKKRIRKRRKAKVRSAPAPLVQGAADSVKMRVLTDLRDSGEGERRSDYGGDQIEDAALYAGQTAARGAETFIRSRIAGLALKRPEAGEPPLYDLPFDLRVSPEPPVPAELPSSAVPPVAELPPATPKAAVLPEDRPLLPAEGRCVHTCGTARRGKSGTCAGSTHIRNTHRSSGETAETCRGGNSSSGSKRGILDTRLPGHSGKSASPFIFRQIRREDAGHSCARLWRAAQSQKQRCFPCTKA